MWTSECVAVCWSVLQCVAVCCSVLLCVAMCCNVLHTWTSECVTRVKFDRDAQWKKHCNTRQFTATHGNSLQHTAIHCNTLQTLHSRSHDSFVTLHQSHSTRHDSFETLNQWQCLVLWHSMKWRICDTQGQIHCNTLQHTATYCNTLH